MRARHARNLIFLFHFYFGYVMVVMVIAVLDEGIDKQRGKEYRAYCLEQRESGFMAMTCTRHDAGQREP